MTRQLARILDRYICRHNSGINTYISQPDIVFFDCDNEREPNPFIRRKALSKLKHASHLLFWGGWGMILIKLGIGILLGIIWGVNSSY
jgi:hypothetical protein